MAVSKIHRRTKRRMHVRKHVSGTAEKPRLSVYRSNQHITAQLIDDIAGRTIAAVTDAKAAKASKQDLAKQVGLEIAKAAKANKVSKVVFDRGGYKFHGRVKAVAEGAREGGLEF